MLSNKQSFIKIQLFSKFFWEKRQVQIFSGKNVEGKNKVTWNLSSSVIEKFNGHEITKHELACQEKKHFIPIDIVYKPIYDKNVEGSCYFTDKIHLAYRSYIGRNIKVEEKVGHPSIRQCYYCENFFAKSDENTNKTWNFVQKKKLSPTVLTIEK